MNENDVSPTKVDDVKQAWIRPEIVDLPSLTELTLASVGGDPIEGGYSGGSTVF